MDAIITLSKYGTVKTCKEIKNTIVTIVLTHGFSCKAGSLLEFSEICMELFPEYPFLETCIIEDELAVIVLLKTN